MLCVGAERTFSLTSFRVSSCFIGRVSCTVPPGKPGLVLSPWPASVHLWLLLETNTSLRADLSESGLAGKRLEKGNELWKVRVYLG